MNRQFDTEGQDFFTPGGDLGISGDSSVDDLIRDLKEQIGSEEAEDVFQNPVEEYHGETYPGDGDFAVEYAPEVPVEEASFEPDFGDAFYNYGEYEEEAPAEPEGLTEEELRYYEALGGEEQNNGPRPKKPKRKRKKRIVPFFVKMLLYLVLTVVGAIGLGYGIWECAQDVLALGRSDEALTIEIKEGQTVEDIAQLLKENGVIKYPWLFKQYCKFTHSEDTMDPGTYVLYYNYDYHALVQGMVKRSPNRVTVRITIPEGYTSANIFAMMESKGVCTVKELEECAANFEFDYWFLEEIPYGSANRLEGFLFPDTYDFYEKDDPDRVLGKLLSNFRKKFSDKAQEQLELLNADLAKRWTAAGYGEDYIAQNRFGIYELMTVASMIEKETAGVAESGKIASVIYNRLCKPAEYPYLNIDATVVYALGGVDHALTYADLEVDSPYNTYKYPGLPAGPISNPGLNSITAALNPTESNYYYYALDKSTRFHYFSKNAKEHNQFLEEQKDD
ncbi:MAG: endolytic transglycosylase MltG [Oscillospiraceae bacterium]|nr:endolytic transglycosylase MltG [Oscillospiraceae bacterium]